MGLSWHGSPFHLQCDKLKVCVGGYVYVSVFVMRVGHVFDHLQSKVNITHTVYLSVDSYISNL